MCPGELHSLLMDSWRATGSSTSPLLLYKVCTHMPYTHTHTHTQIHVEEDAHISFELSV